MNPTWRRRGSTFFFFLVTTTIVGFGYPLNSDEGVILEGAWKMLHGMHLYTDVIEFVAPGAFVLAFLAMKLFGASYWSVKAVAVVLVACSAFALSDITRRIGAAAGSAIGAGIIWILMLAIWFQLINHNTWSSTIAVIGIALFLRAMDQHARAWHFFASGIMIGLTPVFLQTKGGLFAAGMALLFMIFLHRRMISGINTSLALLGIALPTIAVLMAWSPSLLWESLIIWPATHYREVNQVSILPLVFAATLAVWLFAKYRKRADRAHRRSLIILTIAQTALFASVLTRPDAAHVTMAAFTIPILAAAVWGKEIVHHLGKAPDGARARSIAWSVCASLGACIVTFGLLNIAFTQSTLQTIAALEPYKQSQAYAYPFLPGILFAMGIPDPYPRSIIIHTSEEAEMNLAVLLREEPEIILRERRLGDKFGYDWTNPHDQWIATHYRHHQILSGLEILLRNTESEQAVDATP